MLIFYISIKIPNYGIVPKRKNNEICNRKRKIQNQDNRMDRLRKYLKIALPLLFISYLGCLIIFTHVHRVNGVTIVHSHPYHKNSDVPEKEHNMAEFQLLHQLSTIQIGDTSLHLVEIPTFFTTIRIIYNSPIYPGFIRPTLGHIHLRAPPFVFNHIS